MTKDKTYPNIDMVRTGIKLKSMAEAAGYTPPMIQRYLYLSCVQPVYRWYKGKTLPSLDHLFALSKLFHVHMEDLLVEQDEVVVLFEVEQKNSNAIANRLATYHTRFGKLVG